MSQLMAAIGARGVGRLTIPRYYKFIPIQFSCEVYRDDVEPNSAAPRVPEHAWIHEGKPIIRVELVRHQFGNGVSERELRVAGQFMAYPSPTRTPFQSTREYFVPLESPFASLRLKRTLRKVYDQLARL